MNRRARASAGGWGPSPLNADVVRLLEDLFASSERNRLPPEYGGHRIFRAPAIGVCAGNDPIIARFKDVVAPAHLTPAEMWSRSARAGRWRGHRNGIGTPVPDAGTWTDLAALSARIKVLSVVFPYTDPILHDGCRSSHRTPLTGLALNWAHAFHTEVYERTARFFVESGHRVMVPQKSRHYTVLLTMSRTRLVSTWSERHYAFVAGLGTFGLADHLITEFGCNVRLASFITDAPLEVSPRASDDPFANCLFYQRGTCAKCASRCPGGALTRTSHKKLLCELVRQKESASVREVLAPFLKPIRRTFMHLPVEECPIGCGLCQYNVPCMRRNPMARRSPGRRRAGDAGGDAGPRASRNPLPPRFTFPAVEEEVRGSPPACSKQGFTVFFTGLSGSGKSTVANVLLVKLLEMGGRPVTLLDGDLVRKHWSPELGFSKEHRDINVRRIGFLASEITKNGGIALCALIAPYDAVRRDVRRMIEAVGSFLLVHVATPLEVCEQRDRKGLYTRARVGIITDFSGISDPYEAPADAEVVLDTTRLTREDAARVVMLYLQNEGLIGADDRAG